MPDGMAAEACACHGSASDGSGEPRLSARTVLLPEGVNLHTFIGSGANAWLFHRDQIGVAGRGVALRGTPEVVTEALARAHVHDEVGQAGSGPLALGAMPFNPKDPWQMVVPALCVVRSHDGTTWATVVSDGLDEPPDPAMLVRDVLQREATRVSEGGPRSAEVTDLPPADVWCDAVATATGRIRAGGLDKVVLARAVEVRADRDFALDEVLDRLRSSYQGSYVFSIDGIVGATPELLVARQEDLVRSHPMAGSTPITGDAEADEARVGALAASVTYRHEHQVTIDFVHDTLLPYCSYLDDEPEPSVVVLPNVAHLATTVEGRLSHPPASVIDLVRALHPTPAVCGRPTTTAAALISELEQTPRGRYAGAVGWVDSRGNGVWAVTLRCAEIDGSVARLHAGCGLVADSQPETELAESTAKLQVMLRALLAEQP